MPRSTDDENINNDIPPSRHQRPVNHDFRLPPHAEATEVAQFGAGAFDGLAPLHAAPATSAGGGGPGTTLFGRVGAAISRENLVHGLGAVGGRGVVEDDGLLAVFLDHLRNWLAAYLDR
jgi:hypothetical protein